MFSAGDAYERFMGRWSRRIAPLFVRFAGVTDGEAILDVGSGTGALATAVAAAAPSGRVVGIDPAPPFVAFAEARRSPGHVRFEVGDARKIQFADDTFDRTLSLLILNFISDSDTALDEMIRVTRAGGTVAAAVWDYGEGMEMLRVFWDEAVARDASIAAKDERHMPLCRRGELAPLWRHHGLLDVADEALDIDIAFSSFDDYWAPFIGGQGPAGGYVVSMPEHDREDLRSRLYRRLIGEDSDRPFSLHARAWAVRGVLPDANV